MSTAPAAQGSQPAEQGSRHPQRHARPDDEERHELAGVAVRDVAVHQHPQPDDGRADQGWQEEPAGQGIAPGGGQRDRQQGQQEQQRGRRRDAGRAVGLVEDAPPRRPAGGSAGSDTQGNHEVNRMPSGRKYVGTVVLRNCGPVMVPPLAARASRRCSLTWVQIWSCSGKRYGWSNLARLSVTEAITGTTATASSKAAAPVGAALAGGQPAPAAGQRDRAADGEPTGGAGHRGREREGQQPPEGASAGGSRRAQQPVEAAHHGRDGPDVDLVVDPRQRGVEGEHGAAGHRREQDAGRHRLAAAHRTRAVQHVAHQPEQPGRHHGEDDPRHRHREHGQAPVELAGHEHDRDAHECRERREVHVGAVTDDEALDAQAVLRHVEVAAQEGVGLQVEEVRRVAQLDRGAARGPAQVQQDGRVRDGAQQAPQDRRDLDAPGAGAVGGHAFSRR